MKLSKREIISTIFFLFFSLAGWLVCKHGLEKELVLFLKQEEQRFNSVDLDQLKSAMQTELLNRISHAYFTQNIEQNLEHLRKRYQASKLELVLQASEMDKIRSSAEHWKWIEIESSKFLSGIKCTPHYCLDVKIPFTRTWLIDAASSLVMKLSQKDQVGWSSLLESSGMEVPSGVIEYANMSGKLEGLTIGNQRFFASFLGPHQYALHWVTVIDLERLNDLLMTRFLNWFTMSALLFLTAYLLFQSSNHQLPSNYRILIILICLLALQLIIFYLPSQQLNKDQKKLERYSQEKEIIYQKAVKSIKPSYEQVRNILPFQEGGIYSFEEGHKLFLFKALAGELKGHSYLVSTDEDGSGAKKIIALLLLFLASYFWFFRYSNIFWNKMSLRLEQQVSDSNLWSPPDQLNESIVYDHWDLWRNQLEAEEQVQNRLSQQQFFTSELAMLLEKNAGFKAGSMDQFPECAVISLAPCNPEDLDGQVSRNYFKELNRFIETFRETCAKYGGVPFMDNHWSQKALFCMPKMYLSRQRAILFGLNIVRRLEELDLPTGVFYRAAINYGRLDVRVVKSGISQEIIVDGEILSELDAAIDLLGNNRGVWINEQMVTHGPETFFEIEKQTLHNWWYVSGVGNVAEHLSLLDFSTPELQKTAIELLSFKTDDRVLAKILEILPEISAEVRITAAEALRYYFYETEGKKEIFAKISDWAESGHFETIGVVLSILEDVSIQLDSEQISILRSIENVDLRQRVLGLILQNFDQELSDDVGDFIQESSIKIRSLWTLRNFRKDPETSHLDELLGYLNEPFKEEHFDVLTTFGKLLEGDSDRYRDCFLKWLEQRDNGFTGKITSYLQSDNLGLKLRSLRLISYLNLPDMEFGLANLYRSSDDAEFKSEILLTLRSLGSEAFLVQNLA